MSRMLCQFGAYMSKDYNMRNAVLHSVAAGNASNNELTILNIALISANGKQERSQPKKRHFTHKTIVLK